MTWNFFETRLSGNAQPTSFWDSSPVFPTISFCSIERVMFTANFQFRFSIDTFAKISPKQTIRHKTYLKIKSIRHKMIDQMRCTQNSTTTGWRSSHLGRHASKTLNRMTDSILWMLSKSHFQLLSYARLLVNSNQWLMDVTLSDYDIYKHNISDSIDKSIKHILWLMLSLHWATHGLSIQVSMIIASWWATTWIIKLCPNRCIVIMLHVLRFTYLGSGCLWCQW